jgi:hypothetical protein
MFRIYNDNLLLTLKSANTGNFIDYIYIGCLAYADEMTLITPTADTMHKMVAICSEIVKDLSLSFNASTSQWLSFHPM